MNLKAIRRAIRKRITPITNIFAVTWSISNVESRFDTFSAPRKTECFIKATLHVFWHVSSTHCGLRLNLVLHCINIIGKVNDIKAIMLSNIAIGYKGYLDGQALVLALDAVNDLLQGIF